MSAAPPDPADAAFTLDQQTVPMQPGDTVLSAALRAGHALPHLCWHPELGTQGSCRLCTVLVDGQPRAACATPARPGASVVSQGPALQAQRLSLLEMLFAEGNHFCPGCEKSGDCNLQAAAVDAGMTGLDMDPFYPDRPVDASHPDVLLDLNRCILCELCVRASDRLDGKRVFAIGGHGIGTRLLVDSPSGRLGDSRLAADDHAVRVCPVGALLPKRRGFAVPIGQRRFDRPPGAADGGGP